MRFSINIAGVCVSFVFHKKDALFFKKLKARYNAFFTHKTCYIINVYQIPKIGLQKVYVKENPFIICGEGFVFEETQTDCGNLFINGNIYFFENFLRIFVSKKLVDLNGFLVHSAGIFHKNSSILFPARSGFGKTTLSTMLCGSFGIMSDEVCAVVRKKDGFYLFSTPFWGAFKKPASINISAKLCGVFFLKKAKEIKLESVNLSFYLRNIMKTLINFSADVEYSKKAFSIAQRLCHQVSGYLFSFPVDSCAVRKFFHSFFKNQKSH